MPRSKAHRAVAPALKKVVTLLIALCVAACGSLPPPVDIFKHENGDVVVAVAEVVSQFACAPLWSS
jgi:hypothetical protein